MLRAMGLGLIAVACLSGCDDTVFGAGAEVDLGEGGYCGVVELMEAQCTSCHSPAGGAQGGLDLESDFIGATVGVVGAFGQPIIEANSADNSLLYLKITNGQGGAGGAMPLGSTGVEGGAADVVKAWIDDGAAEESCN